MSNVARRQIKDVNELRSWTALCIVTAWDELDQRVIDTAVRQWRTHFHLCVKRKGGHFEHKLS